MGMLRAKPMFVVALTVLLSIVRKMLIGSCNARLRYGDRNTNRIKVCVYTEQSCFFEVPIREYDSNRSPEGANRKMGPFLLDVAAEVAGATAFGGATVLRLSPSVSRR